MFACLGVAEGVGSRARARSCLGANACCCGARVGFPHVLALLAGLGLCRTVRARACLCRGAAGCVSAYALGRHCACPGAVPLARGCFPNRLPAEMGSAAAGAGGGSAAPTGLRRPGQPGDCRQTPEGEKGRAPGRGPEACPQGEAKMGRLRQMDRKVGVTRQAKMGEKVGREMGKRTEAGRAESH